WQQHNSHPLTF
nr:immunoglobulin light chain junction region [Macaca mulatta]